MWSHVNSLADYVRRYPPISAGKTAILRYLNDNTGDPHAGIVPTIGVHAMTVTFNEVVFSALDVAGPSIDFAQHYARGKIGGVFVVDSTNMGGYLTGDTTVDRHLKKLVLALQAHASTGRGRAKFLVLATKQVCMYLAARVCSRTAYILLSTSSAGSARSGFGGRRPPPVID